MDIKDYLHLYIGCKYRIMYIDYEEGQYTLWSILTPDRYVTIMNDASICEIQLLLRPLSDMTEEEAIEFVKLNEFDYYGEHPNKRIYKTYKNEFGETIVSWGEGYNSKEVPTAIKRFRPNEFNYLLKQGFDLFGLLDAGLAKTKK